MKTRSRKLRRLEPITEEQWNLVNEFNRDMLEGFLTNSVELSPKTLKAYRSNLRIWFVWVSEHLKNKSQLDIKPLEFKLFQNWLINRGCSSSDVNNKRAAVSSLNNYIEIYYHDDYPMFRNFINKSIKRPTKAFVYEKEPLTKKEFEDLVNTLRERGDLQKVAYLLFTYSSGCRREESRQLLKEVIDIPPIVKSVGNKTITTYQTHPIRCKGASVVGNVRRLFFDEETMDAIKAWLDERGEDDCPYVFVTKYRGKLRQVSETAFNTWATNTFSPIVGRRFTPHAIRSSRATNAVEEEGKSLESVQALLGHADSNTTKIYVIRDASEDVDELFS